VEIFVTGRRAEIHSISIFRSFVKPGPESRNETNSQQVHVDEGNQHQSGR
jgi:hypothetical protein